MCKTVEPPASARAPRPFPYPLCCTVSRSTAKTKRVVSDSPGPRRRKHPGHMRVTSSRAAHRCAMLHDGVALRGPDVDIDGKQDIDAKAEVAAEQKGQLGRSHAAVSLLVTSGRGRLASQRRARIDGVGAGQLFAHPAFAPPFDVRRLTCCGGRSGHRVGGEGHFPARSVPRQLFACAVRCKAPYIVLRERVDRQAAKSSSAALSRDRQAGGVLGSKRP